MKRAYCHLLVIILLLSAIPLFLPTSDTVQAATTRYVGTGQTYTTIQSAINAASPGDTIRVYAGTYNENVIVNRTLTIIGNGTSATFVKGTNTVGTGHAICVNASNVNISLMNITVKTTTGYKSGIFLSNTYKALKVENCNISDNYNGITTESAVTNSDNIVIKNCTFYNNNQYGIFIWFGKYSIIQNNSFYKCGYGAFTAASTNMKAYYNVFQNCQNAGIYDQTSSGIRIENNTFKNCGSLTSSTSYGFGITYPSSMTFKNNTFVKCSVYMQSPHSVNYWNTHYFSNNSVNGKPIYYAKDKNGLIVPSGQGEVILGNCKNVIIQNQTFDNASVAILLGLSEKVTIRNVTINYTYYGVLPNCCDWINITNCYFNGCRNGIYWYGDSSNMCHNNTMSGNRLRGNIADGIRLDSVQRSRVSNNTFSGFAATSTGTGIYAWNGVRCSVENNTIEDFTSYGIYLNYRSNNNTISNNSITGPASTSYSPWGVYVNYGSTSYQPTYNIFRNNTVSQLTNGGGFKVSYAKNTTIVKNLIRNCRYGIFLDRYTEYARLLDNNISFSTLYGIGSDGLSATYNKWVWIINNTIDKTIGITGVRLYYTNNATVSKNRFDNLATGIVADSYANDIRIDNNSLEDCSKYSINSQGVSPTNMVRRVTVYNNTCLRSNYGIRLYFTNISLLANNTVEGSTNWGVELNSSAYITAVNNTIEQSASYGLRSRLCANVAVHHNCFVANGGAKSQAFDQSSTAVAWDNGTEGNWWSNWTRPDANWDHIVDRPYNIDLTTVQDRYPLTSFIPHVLAPKNLTPSEDVFYQEKFTDDSGNATEWTIRTNASWLTSITGNVFSGTPDNGHAQKTYWINGSAKGAKGQSDFLNVTIKVNNTNDAPYITTSDNPDAQKNLLYASDYNATDIDPTFDVLTWSLKTNATWLSIAATTGWLNGTPSAAQIGKFWANVTVSDGHGGLAWHNFTITVVNQINYAPVITSLDDLLAVEDALYNNKYNYTDPNMEAVTWSLSTNASFLSINTDGWLNGTPTNDNALKTYWANVTCKDPGGKKDFSNFTLAVLNVNDPPVITTDNLTTAMEDAAYSVDYNATDPDPTGDTITWTMRSNTTFLAIASATGVLSGTPQNQHVGPHWVNITAQDNHGGEVSINFTLTVLNTNDDPQISTPLITSAYEDADYFADINATDVDAGDAFTWTMTSNASFLAISSSNGVLSGIPRNQDVGPHWVNVTVSDGNGGSDWRNYTFLVINTNDAPEITNPDNLTAYEDIEYSCQYNATDMDPTGDQFTWYLYTNASFLKMGSSTGLLSGTPSDNAVGRTFMVNVSVFDGRGGWGWSNFTLSVLNTNDPPAIDTMSLPAAKEDEQYSFNLSATDPDPTNDTLTWQMRTNATFLSIDPLTGRLFGLPERKDLGPHWLNATVTDEWGASTCKNLTLAVSKRANHPVTVLKPSTDITFKEDESLDVDLNSMFLDEDGEALRFGYVGGQGNATASVKAGGKATVFAPKDWSGRETITFSCSDKSGTKYANVVATVTPVNDPPADLSADHKAAYAEGGDQTVSASATDPDIPYGDALTFSWYVNETQTATGASVNLSLKAGAYTITVKVADKAGETANLSFQITVEASGIIIPDDDDENVTDSDGDGLLDDWEMKYFSNLDQNATGDPDGDGKTNIEEQQAGTDPTKAPEEGEGASNNYLLWIILALVLLIVIAVIIAIVVRSKKKKDEGALPEPQHRQVKSVRAAEPAPYEATIAEPESVLPDPKALDTGLPEPAPMMDSPSMVFDTPPTVDAVAIAEPAPMNEEPPPAMDSPVPVEQVPSPVAEPPPSEGSLDKGPLQEGQTPPQKKTREMEAEIEDLFKL